MINKDEKNNVREQIKQKLNDLLLKRLNIRIQQKLCKHYTNCKYSKTLNRFYVCCNKQNLNAKSYLICSDQHCKKCHLYEGKYKKQDKGLIQQQFYNDINDPSVCGNKQPKIAMLIWVLKIMKNDKLIVKQEKNTIWTKIKRMLRIGYVQK